MDLAAYFDHTLLNPDSRPEAIETLCKEALTYGFASVCIPPFYIGEAVRVLQEHENEKVGISTVIGFPMGYSATAAKVEEIKRAIEEGATEIDGVINLCAVKSENWNFVRNDMDSLITATKMKGRTIKLILETTLLTETEIRKIVEIALELNPDFLKTSTGINGGYTMEVVHLLQELTSGQIAIKASGGIRKPEQALALIEAGVKRIGSSQTISIYQHL